MEPNISDFHMKRIEKAISNIGAKIADAAELSQKAKEMSETAELLLTGVQLDLEELYLTVDPKDL